MSVPAPEEVRYVGAEVCQEILAHAVDRRDTLRERVRFWFPNLTPAEQITTVQQLLECIEATAGLVLMRRLKMEEAGTMRRPERNGGTPRAEDRH